MKYLQIIIVSLLFISCGNNDSSINNSPSIITQKDCGTFDLTVTNDSTGDYYYITDVRIIPIDKEAADNKTNYFHCKTLENKIAFEVRTKYIRLDSTEIKNIPNVKSDPIVGEVINPIIYSNASLKLDKDIFYKNEVVASNTNILNVAEIKSGEFYFPFLGSHGRTVTEQF